MHCPAEAPITRVADLQDESPQPPAPSRRNPTEPPHEIILLPPRQEPPSDLQTLHLENALPIDKLSKLNQRNS